MGQLVSVLISVDVSRPGGLARTADALRSAGLQIGEVLEAIGTITGTCPEEKIPNLEQIAGVLSVERSRDIAIPPPGSSIQ